MPHAISMPSVGLQALILCGPGSSFPTFTSNPDANPKALLPIANRPMVWYPIDFCYRMGITDITLICPPSASEALKSGLGTNPYLSGLPLPRPDVLAPEALDYNTGTAEILRQPEVRELITSDFIVLPCDLVCEMGGEKLIQAWMVQSASLTELLGSRELGNASGARQSGGLSVWYDTKTAPIVKKEETDFVAVTETQLSPLSPPRDSLFQNLSNLVYSMPTDSLRDLTEERKGLPIRHSLVRTHPRVRMLTTRRDAHIYIFPKWILDFVEKNERLDSIGEDVVGWWAKSTWQTGLATKLHVDELEQQDDASEMGSNHGSTGTPPGTSSGHPETQSMQDSVKISSSSTTQKTATLSQDAKAPSSKVPPILAYMHPKHENAPTVRRVDTAQLLLAISLQLAKIPSIEEAGPDEASPFAHQRKVAYPEGVKSRTTITKQDCLVADNVTVEEKTSIKECVIGAGCQINEGAKLTQCLLMEGVVIGKGCKLSKCILGKRCVIGDGSILTDCEVQENLLVEERTEDKDNRLMSSEGLEATEAEMEEVLQEMEDSAAGMNDSMN